MPASPFNPELAAERHNKILELAWKSGRQLDALPSTTWWEHFSPISFDLASRLKPKLIRFLRSVEVGNYNDQKFYLFFHVRGLWHKDWLFLKENGWMSGSPHDRYISLYYASGSHSDEEAGIVFDQETELASFIPLWEDLFTSTERDWPWMPLQDIFQACLDMIENRKVTTYSHIDCRTTRWECQKFPWEIHQYTSIDVERAISAFTRLLNAIESRLPQNSQSPLSPRLGETSTQGAETQSEQQICFPYTDSALDNSFVQDNSFAREFLSMLPARRINFRYIAPGVQLQSLTDDQPFADRRDNYDHRLCRKDETSPSIPLLLFRGEGENKSPEKYHIPWSA